MEHPEYEKFSDECNEFVSEIQEAFIKLYDLNIYEHWYYDHGLVVFTFQHGEKKVYFRYIEAGTFSRNTNTWKWSWDNEHTPDRAKAGIDKVKAYGEENRFERLTTGLMDGDEYTGWEFVSIAAKLLNGIGVYKAPSDHLDIFFVFTDEVPEDSYNALRKKYVSCGEHGSRRRAYVCQHLNTEETTGFHEAFPSDPDDEDEPDDYQAWCDQCEEARLKEGEWNDVSEAFAKVRLVCSQCFFEMKQHNLGYTKW